MSLLCPIELHVVDGGGFAVCSGNAKAIASPELDLEALCASLNEASYFFQ